MNEHHRELMHELAAVGLKPRLRRTPGGHVRIEWDLGGKPYSIVTSKTPSDRRATFNARARIRPQLRDAGVYQRRQERSLARTTAPLVLLSLGERSEERRVGKEGGARGA